MSEVANKHKTGHSSYPSGVELPRGFSPGEGRPSRSSLAELPRETTSAFLKKGEREGAEPPRIKAGGLVGR